MELKKVKVIINNYNFETLESEKITFIAFLELNAQKLLFDLKTAKEVIKYLLSRVYFGESKSEIQDIIKYENSNFYYFNYLYFEYKEF